MKSSTSCATGLALPGARIVSRYRRAISGSRIEPRSRNLGEQVFRDHEGPQVRVVDRGVEVQVNEAGLEVRAGVERHEGEAPEDLLQCLRRVEPGRVAAVVFQGQGRGHEQPLDVERPRDRVGPL